MSTIKDVAQQAGVSIATVSNYLNHTKPVSRQTAAKIKDAVEALRYAQNLSAKNLKSNLYTEIGVILPNLNDPYYIQIYQGIERAFSGSPYFLNVAFSYDIPELEQCILHNLLKKQICGLILISAQPDNWSYYYENFTAAGRPVVMIDRLIKNFDANYVTFDNYAVTKQLTTYLLQARREKLYLFSGPESFTCEADCVRGFTDAHLACGVPLAANACIRTDLNREDAFRQIINQLKTDVPNGIVATCESTATGITEGLRLLGHDTDTIPVFTLGEEHWNRYTHSFATFSTARPAIKMGQTAAQLLLDQLASPHVVESRKVILRDTAFDSKHPFSELPGKLPAHAAGREEELRILMLDTPVVHAFRGLLKNFELQTGIQTELKILPHHHLYAEIMDRRQTEREYDVYLYDIPWLPTLAAGGMLADLTSLLDTIDTGIFLPDCLNHFSRFQNRYYGIPFMYAPQMFYYRKDLFDDPRLRAGFERCYDMALRPPVSLKEFNVIADYFTNQTDAIPYGISVAAAYDECLAPELYMRMQAYGSMPFDSGGNVIFDSPQTIKAYQNFQSALQVAKPDYLQATDVSVVNDFLCGTTAMVITYPAFMADVSDLRKNSMIGSIGYGLIPGRTPLLGGWSLGIASRSPQKEAAFAFLKWTCDKQIGNYFALLGGQSAITSTYTNDELVKLYPWLPLYYSANFNAKPTVMPTLPNGRIVAAESVDAAICRWAYRLINGESDIRETIAGTQAELETLMKGYWGKD